MNHFIFLDKSLFISNFFRIFFYSFIKYKTAKKDIIKKNLKF